VKKFQKILLFVLLFGTMLIFGLIENIKGVSYPLIKMDFQATDVQQGIMVSMLSMAYVSFSIIAGIFLSKFGIKPSYLFGYSTLCIGLFAVFFMPGFFSTSAALFLIFAGFGFFEIGTNALASRIFVTKTALLMNLLHAFYGIGAMLGPKAASMIISIPKFNWRYVYLLSLPLALIFFIPSVFTRFPENTISAGDKTKSDTGHKSFFDALKSPMVWLMAITLGLAIIVEMNNSNWGPLYFWEVFNKNPETEGAAFVSSFFLIFTISRLVSGPFVEKIGYTRTLMGVSFLTIIVFIVGFSIGENGIRLLPANGFFIALLWPTIMAVAVVIFGKDAPVFASAMIAIGGLLNAGVQFIIGLTNKIFGPQWGYRSSILYTVLLLMAVILLHRKFREYKKA